LSCSRRNKNIAEVFLAASARDTAEHNFGAARFALQVSAASDGSALRFFARAPFISDFQQQSASPVRRSMTLLLRSLAAVSAECRHEAQQFLIVRILVARSTNCANTSRKPEITGDEQWL
jgi:hypothetical protein